MVVDLVFREEVVAQALHEVEDFDKERDKLVLRDKILNLAYYTALGLRLIRRVDAGNAQRILGLFETDVREGLKAGP